MRQLGIDNYAIAKTFFTHTCQDCENYIWAMDKFWLNVKQLQWLCEFCPFIPTASGQIINEEQLIRLGWELITPEKRNLIC